MKLTLKKTKKFTDQMPQMNFEPTDQRTIVSLHITPDTYRVISLHTHTHTHTVSQDNKRRQR